MYTTTQITDQEVQVKRRVLPDFSTVYVHQPDLILGELLANLSPYVPWGDRKAAAQKLGNLRQKDALPGLLTALHSDPFWMVRCAIIQAVEKIGDPEAIPELRKAAAKDNFQVVRLHASKAIERLS